MRSNVRGKSRFGDDSGMISTDENGGFSINTDAAIDAGVQAGGANAKAILAAVGSGAAIGGLIGNVIPIPGIGAAIGATVGSIVGLVVGVASFLNQPQKCYMTFGAGGVEIHDYPTNVKNAADWVHGNMDKAVSMTSNDLYNQLAITEDDFIVWFNVPERINTDFHSCVVSTGMYDTVLKKLPGARSLLRTVQIPAAAALAAATPELIGLYKLTFPNTFPALYPEDVAKIAARIQPILDQKIHDVQVWITKQQYYPTFDQVHAAYPMLVPADINRAMSATAKTQAQSQAEAVRTISTIGPKKLQVGPAKPKLANIPNLDAVLSNVMQSSVIPKKEHWWQVLLEKVHLRKKPVIQSSSATSKPSAPVSSVLNSGKFQKL
jgi:hypothetical protein